MDDPRPLRKRLTGTEQLALQFVPKARVLLQSLKRRLGDVKVGAMRMITPDGVEITAKTFGVGPDVIEIDILGASFCEPLGELKGFVCLPQTVPGSSYYVFPAAGGGSLPRPEVVVTPSQASSSAQVKYQGYLYSKVFPIDVLPAFKAKASVYSTRSDTCGNEQLPWYADRLLYGNVDWRGVNDVTLSWFGSPCRYLDGTDTVWISTTSNNQPNLFDGSTAITIFTPPVSSSQTFSRLKYGGLFYRGKRISPPFPSSYGIDANGVSGGIAGEAVSGACIGYNSAGQRYLILTTAVHPLQNGSTPGGVTVERVWAVPCAIDKESLTFKPSDTCTLLQTLNWTSPGGTSHSFNLTPWLFNQSGTQGVSNRTSAGGLNRYFLNVNLDAMTAAVVQDVSAYSITSNWAPQTSNDTAASLSYTPCYTGPSPGVRTANYLSSQSGSYSSQSSLDLRFGDYVGDTFTEMVVSYRSAETGSWSASNSLTLSSCPVGSSGGDGNLVFNGVADYTAYLSQSFVITIDGVTVMAPQALEQTTTGHAEAVNLTAADTPTGTVTATTPTGYLFNAFLALDIRKSLVVAQMKGGRVIGKLGGATIYDNALAGTHDVPVPAGPSHSLSLTGVSNVDTDSSVGISLANNAIPGITPSGVGGGQYLVSPLMQYTAGAHYGAATTKEAVFLCLPTLALSSTASLGNRIPIGNGEPRIRYLTDSDPATETGIAASTPLFAPIGVM